MNNKFLSYSLAFHSILILIVFYVFYKMPPTNISNNVVTIEKEFEMINNIEDEFSTNIQNLEKNILSGFFIDDLTIVTAAHGLNNFDSNYTITDKFGEKHDASLYEKNDKEDIAYLKITSPYKNFVKIKIADTSEIGEKVFCISHSGAKKIGQIENIDKKRLSSNIIFEDGDSGSPLFNNKNQLIGINLEVDLINNKGISYLFQ